MTEGNVDFSKVEDLIKEECQAISDLLISKNRAYGNSALDPLRIFSKADPYEQIKIRIDDKLSRVFRGHADGEDIEKDLIGYLVLLRVCRRLHPAIHPTLPREDVSFNGNCPRCGQFDCTPECIRRDLEEANNDERPQPKKHA